MIEDIARVRARWGVLSCLLVLRLCVSYLVLLPWLVSLGAGKLDQLPGADVHLMDQGGLLLVEWLRLEGATLLAGARASLLLFLVGLLTMLPLLACLLSALRSPGPLTLEEHGLRALAALPALTLLEGVALLLRVLVLFLTAAAWSAGTALVAPPSYPWLLLVTLTLGGVLWVPTSVWHDLARASAVGQQTSAAAAARLGFGVLCRRACQALGYYLLFSGVAASLLAVGLALPKLLGRLGPESVWISFLVHQLAQLLALLARAVWLSRALALTSSSLPRLDDTRANSGEPAGPSPDPSA